MDNRHRRSYKKKYLDYVDIYSLKRFSAVKDCEKLSIRNLTETGFGHMVYQYINKIMLVITCGLFLCTISTFFVIRGAVQYSLS